MTDRNRLISGWSEYCPAFVRPPRLDVLCSLLQEVRAAGFDALVENFLNQLSKGSLSFLFEVVFCRWLLQRHPADRIEYEPPPSHDPDASPPDFRLNLDEGTVDFQLKYVEQIEHQFAIAKFLHEFRRWFKRRTQPLFVDLAFGLGFDNGDIKLALRWLRGKLTQPQLKEWLDYRDSNGDLALLARFRERSAGEGLAVATIKDPVGLSEPNGGPVLEFRKLDTRELRKKLEKKLESSKKSLHTPTSDTHVNVVVLGLRSDVMVFLDELVDIFYGSDQIKDTVMVDGGTCSREQRERDGLFCLSKKVWLNAALILLPETDILTVSPDFTWFLNPVHFASGTWIGNIDPGGKVVKLPQWE